MNHCLHPIDPIDADALAAGAEPVLAPEAGVHVRECPACQERVESAGRFAVSLEGAFADGTDSSDLAGRIIRLRAFSRRERRDFALWRGGAGLAVGVFFAGGLLVTLPALTGREQAALSLQAASPMLALARSFLFSLAAGAASAPAALEALAQSLRGQSSLGLAALVLLAPAFFGLKWAVARARR